MTLSDLKSIFGEGSVLDGFGFPLLVAGIAAVVTWGITPLVRRFAISKNAVDDPTVDDRRVHTEPTPRWGGIAIFSGLLVSLLLVLPFAYPQSNPFPVYVIALFVIGLALVVIGALDDIHQYRARVQFAYLLIIGFGIQFLFDNVGRVQISGMELPPFSPDKAWVGFGWLALPITAIYIFVVTKTMDTIDGVDGLAAGVAGIAGVTLAVIAVMTGQPRVALIAAAIAGASLGFLPHNYNPAKIFMGTGGAQMLGFMLAVLSIVGAFKTAAAFVLFLPLLIFGVPIFDAVFVIIKRIVSRQPITKADKRHVHHTLLSKGFSQRQTVWILYTIAAALSLVLLILVKSYG
ncbi:MAG: undecaprenyl/decaprenyl-phosphate alpha-N-acetylglucosaminyl 1-phosphate transferase [Armatimonadetes bacterium]|nr:undecaprenyl/decaprenyl-phosphate alpha-N-acetylglucosaminyl 1-phosphate transferase [Armatimonadota bacterium]